MNFVKNFTSFLIAFSVLLLSACKKDAQLAQDALAYVPATSTMVSAVNLKKLMEKADFESVRKMDFYQAMLKETEQKSPELNRILLDPESSGIDLDQKMYMAIDVNPANPEDMISYLLLPLKNASDFANTFKSYSGNITKKDGINLFHLSDDDNVAISWNDRLAVFALSNIRENSWTDNMLKIYKPSTSNPLASNPKLQKLVEADHDFVSWMSTDALAENESAGFALNMIDVHPEALKGNYIASYGDFEKGKITGHADFFLNKSLGEGFIGRFFNKEASTDFSEILPGDNLLFAVSGALDLVGTDKFLSERPQSKDYADFVLNDLGMKRKDLIEVFGGDVMIAAYQSSDSSDDPTFLLAANVKNRKKGQEFLDLAEKEGKLKKTGEGQYKIVSLGNEDFSITRSRGMGYILLKNDILLFSTEIEMVEKVKAGTASTISQTNKEIQSLFNGQTLAGWMDMARMNENLKGLQTNWMKEMKFNINSKGADFNMETSEPDNNSLNTLFKMMNEAYLQRGKDWEEKSM